MLCGTVGLPFQMGEEELNEYCIFSTFHPSPCKLPQPDRSDDSFLRDIFFCDVSVTICDSKFVSCSNIIALIFTV